MKKILNLRVVENRHIHDLYSLLILSPADGNILPEIKAGQFVNIAVDGSKNTFLRRPISINYIDRKKNIIWLLIRKAGSGTAALTRLKDGDIINTIIPLGNSFVLPKLESRVLLVGGGVGVAPMLCWGNELIANGIKPLFLLGARTQYDVLELEEFQKLGDVHISTEDGSMGESGLVTEHSILKSHFDIIYCCGPAPMMKAVAKVAAALNAECYVSLENMMACGLGACLCCVEQTVKGNVCVCTEGPIFNTKQLTWQI